MADSPARTTQHVLMLVDESGSMATVADDTRGGFNTYLDDLAADTDIDYRVTVARFNHGYRRIGAAATAPADVPRMTRDTYKPGGNTALYDAVARIVADFQHTTTLEAGQRAALVVMTDGFENASTEHTLEQVRDKLTELAATGVWGQFFIGAGPDAWTQAGAMGFATANTVAVPHTRAGTRGTYAGLASASAAYARGADEATTARHIRDAANQ